MQAVLAGVFRRRECGNDTERVIISIATGKYCVDQRMMNQRVQRSQCLSDSVACWTVSVWTSAEHEHVDSINCVASLISGMGNGCDCVRVPQSEVILSNKAENIRRNSSSLQSVWFLKLLLGKCTRPDFGLFDRPPARHMFRCSALKVANPFWIGQVRKK